MNYTLTCPDTHLLKIKDIAGVTHCSGGWSLVPVPEQFSIEQLNPVDLGMAFGAGFTLVSTILIFGIGVRAFLNFIKS